MIRRAATAQSGFTLAALIMVLSALLMTAPIQPTNAFMLSGGTSCSTITAIASATPGSPTPCPTSTKTVTPLATSTTLSTSTVGSGVRAEYYLYAGGSVPIDPLKLQCTRLEPLINTERGDFFIPSCPDPPDPLAPNNIFAVRWTGYIVPRYTERYTFRFSSVDDGAHLWINGRMVISRWYSDTESRSGQVDLTAGQRYPIVVDYHNDWAAYNITLNWSSASQTDEVVPSSQLYLPNPSVSVGAGSGDGLRGRYFDDRNTSPRTYFTTEKGNRVDPLAGNPDAREGDFFALEWSGLGNGPGFYDGNGNSLFGAYDFSARWTGAIQPRYSETYIFALNGDDGARLWVNGQLLIDGWSEVGRHRGKITLKAGQLYPIKMEYWAGGAFNLIALRWVSYSQSLDLVPRSQLYSFDVGVVPDDSTPTPTLGTSIVTDTATPSASVTCTPNGTDAARGIHPLGVTYQPPITILPCG